MPALVTIRNGQFQDAAGTLQAGTLVLQLSQDAVVSGTGQVAPKAISIAVTAGQAAATPVWGNDNLTPSGTTYTARLFDTSGALVWGPENWSITGAGPIEINTLIPASGSVSYSGAVLLNPSGDQTVLAGNLAVGKFNSIIYVDGVRYATIAAAVAAAPSGGTVYSPPGHSETISSSIAITKPLTIILDGNILTGTVNSLTSGVFAISGTVTGVEIRASNNTTLTLTGTNVVGVTLNGTITDAEISGLNIVGSGVVGDSQYGVLAPDTASANCNKVRITDCTITSTMVGIGIYCQTVGVAKGVVIDHNHISGMVGVLSGQGYGIAVAGATAQPADTRVEFNYIELGQRHDIYISQGSGAVVMGNVSRLHRQAVANNTAIPAFEIGRAQGVIVVGNFIDQSYDGGIQVFTDPSGTTSRNTVITNNVINNGQYWDIIIGTTTPATDGFPTQVIVQGNSIYKSGINQFGIYVASGKDISILGNTVQNLTSTSDVLRFEGSQETAGTALYTDRIFVRGNNFIGTGSGGGITFAATAAASGINMEFAGNRVNAPTNWFVSGGAGLTNLNVKLVDTDYLQNANAFLTNKQYLVSNAMGMQLVRSAGLGAVPDLFGDGTNALVIGGKTDGSGTVAFGTTSAVQIPKTLSVGGDTAMSANPRAYISGYIPVTNGTGTWAQSTLDKAITITRVQILVGGSGVGQTTAAIVRVGDNGSNNVDTTIANSTGSFDSGAVTVNIAAAATLIIRVNTASVGGTAPTNLNVVVQYKMQ